MKPAPRIPHAANGTFQCPLIQTLKPPLSIRYQSSQDIDYGPWGNHILNSRSRGRLRLWSLLAILATVLTLLFTAGPASASSPIDQQRAVFLKVMNSPDRQTAFEALSAADQVLFAQAFQQDIATVTESRLVATTVVGPKSSAAATTRCWSHYWYYSWHDFGIHDGDSWMQFNWCGNGSSVSKLSISQTGGRGLAGVSYDGVKATGIRNVGWEGHGYVEYEFNLFWDHEYPCLQVRGGDTGLYSTRGGCNLN